MTELIIVSVVISLFLLILGFIFIFLGKLAFTKSASGKPKSLGLLFNRSNFYRIIIVLAIIFALLVIVILGKENDAILTLLSTLAGVSLGGMVTSQEESTASSYIKSRSIIEFLEVFESIIIYYKRDAKKPGEFNSHHIYLKSKEKGEIVLQNIPNIKIIEYEDNNQFENDFEE